VPQSQQEIDPNPSLTYSLRDPEVTDFQTQNGSTSTTESESTTAAATPAPSMTEIAAFTAPNGGKYTATAIDGTMRIAGYQLTVGGPDALVGGVRVSAASDGLKHGDMTAAYARVTGSSTTQVVSTSTDAAGSTQVVSSKATVAVAESTGSSSASESESQSGSATASSSGASESAASTGAAAAGATAKSRDAIVALGGLGVLLCLFA
jgi:hypothetical protein